MRTIQWTILTLLLDCWSYVSSHLSESPRHLSDCLSGRNNCTRGLISRLASPDKKRHKSVYIKKEIREKMGHSSTTTHHERSGKKMKKPTKKIEIKRDFKPKTLKQPKMDRVQDEDKHHLFQAQIDRKSRRNASKLVNIHPLSLPNHNKKNITNDRFRRIHDYRAKRKPKVYVNSTVAKGRGMSTLNTHINNRQSRIDPCDNRWYKRYSTLHSRAARLINSVPSEKWSDSLFEKEHFKVVIYIAREGLWNGRRSGGVGDRFSLISVFAMCVLHNAAFFIDYPGLSEVFVSGKGGLLWSVNASGYIAKNGYRSTVTEFPDHEEMLSLFSNPKKSITVVRTARGMITYLFQSYHYKPLLEEMGFDYGKYSCNDIIYPSFAMYMSRNYFWLSF